MDPDKAWDDLAAMAERVSTGQVDFAVPGLAESYADGMAELVHALSEWAANGGFPPAVFLTPKKKV